MFRELTKIKQKLRNEECIEILKSEKRGVLSINGLNGYPYGIPLNHYYNEEDNRIYFHSGKIGYKIDSLKENNKVCYTVYDKGYLKDDFWALNVKSVIIFGSVYFVNDINKIEEISRKLSYKFINDEKYINDEINRSLKNTLMFYIEIENMCGKLVNES